MYTSTALIREFRKKGLPMCLKTLHNYQKAGKLVLRRLPNNRRVCTESELKEIISAFLPGGSGCWVYSKQLTNSVKRGKISIV